MHVVVNDIQVNNAQHELYTRVLQKQTWRSSHQLRQFRAESDMMATIGAHRSVAEERSQRGVSLRLNEPTHSQRVSEYTQRNDNQHCQS